MSRTYTQRCFNIPVRIYHRDVESLTQPSTSFLALGRRAPGAVLSYAEALDHITWRRLIRAPHVAAFLAIQHGRFVCYPAPGVRQAKPNRPLARILVFLFRPAGVLLYGLDRLRLTEKLRGWLERLHLRFW